TPIYQKALLPVLGPTREKAIAPMLKFANEEVLKPTMGAVAKVINPVLEPLLYPLRKLQEVLTSAATSLLEAQEFIEGKMLYKTDAQGKFELDAQGQKIPLTDKDGIALIDPKNPSLPERVVNVIQPVYALVAKFGGQKDASGKSSFVDVVG